LYLWNKNNEEHLFFEVDSSDDGWGACAFQYTDKAPSGEDEGKHHLLSKKPKRIIAWCAPVRGTARAVPQYRWQYRTKVDFALRLFAMFPI
jgi:hypothetical protein